MKRLNVRWRLTLWYGTVLSVIVAGFGVTAFLMMRQHLSTRIDFELEEEVGELALEVRLARDEAELKEQLQRRFFHHAGYDFQVSTSDGHLVFCSERLIANPLIEPRLQIGSTSLAANQRLPILGESRVVSRAESGTAGRFIVQSVYPLAGNQEQLRALMMVLVTVGPLAIAGALAGGYVLARKALAPVEQMRVTAEQITADQLNQRLDVLNSDDELGRLARTLNQMIDRLQRSLDDMRRFTADAAHELRTPLAVLRTELEVALRSPRSAADYEHVVEVALEETKRLIRLADQLLILCRQEAGFQNRESEDVQLEALLLDVADKARATAERMGLTLEVGPLESGIVVGDDIQLSQLFFNLLDNAIKYTPDAGTIRICSAVRDREVCIVFEDTGVGIPAEHLPHLFERFYRVDPSRNAESGGAGLGLSICKAIAESHGGRITVESTVGRGTKFRVVLPGSATVHDDAYASQVS